MSKEDFADLLALAVKGSRCEGGHDGSVYREDREALEKFRAWLVEAEVMTAGEAKRA